MSARLEALKMILQQTKMQKKAFAPIPAGPPMNDPAAMAAGGGAAMPPPMPPMDPAMMAAMGGGAPMPPAAPMPPPPPMDPTMMAAGGMAPMPPMDPSMMAAGGMPPMDPTMMAAGGMPPQPSPEEMNAAAVDAGAVVPEEDPSGDGKITNKELFAEVQTLKEMVSELMSKLDSAAIPPAPEALPPPSEPSASDAPVIVADPAQGEAQPGQMSASEAVEKIAFNEKGYLKSLLFNLKR